MRLRLESRSVPIATRLAEKAAAFTPPLPASWRVYRLRIALRWTQAELAERAGVSKRTVERIEAGSAIEQRTSRAILRAFAIPTSDRSLVFPRACGRSCRFHAEQPEAA